MLDTTIRENFLYKIQSSNLKIFSSCIKARKLRKITAMLKCVLLAFVVMRICTKPPNRECFSAVIWGWMYPSAFPTQPIVPNHEAFPGLRVQGTANRLAPPPMMFPCPNSNHFLNIDGKRLTQTSSLQPTVCEMRNLYCIHTTPSPDTHQATFPTCQSPASQHPKFVPCQNYIFGLLGLLANKWIYIKSAKVKSLLYLERRHLYELGTEITYLYEKFRGHKTYLNLPSSLEREDRKHMV